jgi:acetyl esterase/lipase
MKKLSMTLFLGLLSCYLLFGQPDSIVYKQTPQADLKLYFGYPPDWTASDSRPAIVFFFGGGWRSGTVEHFRTQADYLARRGMVAIRADYRVKSRHGTFPDQCVEDGKSAIRWVRSNAGKLGVNPDMIAGSGGSAGGHVAACAALVDGLEAIGEDHAVSSKPDILVLYNPVMEIIPERHLERFRDTAMAEMLSPLRWISSEMPDGILFFGTDDRLLEGAIRSVEKADAAGARLELWTAKGQQHGFFNQSPWLEWTLYLTDRFLQKHGYLTGKAEIRLPDEVTMDRYPQKGK